MGSAGRAGDQGAGQPSETPSVEIRRGPAPRPAGRQPDYRRGSRAPGAGAGKSGACAANRASPSRSMPACSSSCPARSPERTGTRPRPCASSSRAAAPTPRWTARRRSWKRGDFVITPPWAWHDHGNDSDRPMIWLDGLDVPMVNSFDTSFAGESGGGRTAAFPAGRSIRRTTIPTTCCRSATRTRGTIRRSSTIPTPGPARRWTGWRPTRNGTRATA